MMEFFFKYLHRPIDKLSQITSNNYLQPLSTFSVKQLISKEINAEKLKRKNKKNNRGDNKYNVKLQENPNTVNVTETLTPTDFFGRKIDVKVDKNTLDITSNVKNQYKPPQYKYFEGFSNAVRKPVKMSSLI